MATPGPDDRSDLILCRDCETRLEASASRCPRCGSPRLLYHPELADLAIAHLDCDAFYAAVEKRDRPELADKPVIVGGRERGVVATACYIARLSGVGSAMPMARALKLCPDAVVLPPDMARYRQASFEIRALMDAVAPVVEPLSVDEAFLDLTGTTRLHRRPPAETLVRLAGRIRREVGITVSIGLSYNKFLAKVASDRDKPRGFFVIGRAEARDFLARKPVSLIWGVGRALEAKLARDGITRISELQDMEESDLMARYGVMGRRLYRFARGEDHRAVTPSAAAKSVSVETTLPKDLSALGDLERELWRLAEELAGRLRRKALAGKTVTLKLKTASFRLRTRAEQLGDPTRLAAILYRTGQHLLAREVDGTPFRLIGIGVSDLVDADLADPPDLVDRERERARVTEAAIDRLRDKYGGTVIGKGRGLKPPRPGGDNGSQE